MRLITLLQKLRRSGIGYKKTSIHDLLKRVQDANTAPQLTKAVNKLQEQLWVCPKAVQAAPREQLMKALQNHVLYNQQSELRIEAASWVRLLVQAGLTTQPQTDFALLVTAVTQNNRSSSERLTYLKLLFECFWPFRYPYTAFSWDMFPSNDIFFPLATLLHDTNRDMQEAILAIFAELPTLDEAEIAEPLLPVALQWATHSDAECRRRVTQVLARLTAPAAQSALQRLLSDTDPIVRASAKNAMNYARK
jgi:hypothetical protein